MLPRYNTDPDGPSKTNTRAQNGIGCIVVLLSGLRFRVYLVASATPSRAILFRARILHDPTLLSALILKSASETRPHTPTKGPLTERIKLAHIGLNPTP